MDGRFVGHRGSSGNEWSWEPASPPGRRPGGGTGGPSRRALLLAALAMFAAAAVFVTLALVNGGGGTVVSSPTPSPTPAATGSPTPRQTRSPSPRPTPAATATPQATPSPTPSPSPSASPAPSAQLAAWLPDEKRWADRDVPPAGRFEEGSSAGFLLRMYGVRPGESYRIEIAYDCAVAPAAGFDFLTGLPDRGSAVADVGPGRTTPDATIPIPDDSDIAFDDGLPGRVFSLWGGSFDDAPTGPLPDTPCVPGRTSARRFMLDITARQETVFVMFRAHLASASDWGTGKGASNAGTELGVRVRLDSGDWLTLALPPGSVAP